MKLAKLWKPLAGKKVKCSLCERRCTIPDGALGMCRARQNKNGKLYSIVYGKLCASGVDPIEKKPLFHFLPGSDAFSISTTGCNYRCKFCQNWQISQAMVDQIPFNEMAPSDVVKAAQAADCKTIAYTYTEPTIFYEYARDVSEKAVKHDLRNIFVTNGYMTPAMLKDYGSLLHAANIDIKGNAQFYKKMCGGVELKHVLKNIERMHDAGVWVEVTNLIVPGYNDKKAAVKKLAESILSIDPDIPIHFSAFFPQYLMTDTPPTPRDTLVMARKIATNVGINYAYCGNTFPGDPFENTYCPECGDLVIKRHGYNIVSMSKNAKCERCGHQVPGVFV